jgi:hypothetical protein
VQAPCGGGKAFEEDEAFAVEEVGAEAGEAFGEGGEREVVLYSTLKGFVTDLRCVADLRNAGEWDAGSDEIIAGLAQLFNFLVSEAVGPFLGVVLVIISSPNRGPLDLLREVFVGSQEVGNGLVLARSLDAVWEDVFGCIIVVVMFEELLSLRRRGDEGCRHDGILLSMVTMVTGWMVSWKDDTDRGDVDYLAGIVVSRTTLKSVSMG